MTAKAFSVNGLYQQLQQRNAAQSDPFKQLVANYTIFLEQNRDLSEKNVDLQKEIVRLAYSNTELQKKVTSLQIPESDPRVVSELEKKIQRLQEELTASYKRNSDNATTLLDLNAQVKDMQDEIKSKDNEIESWKSKFNGVEEHLRVVEAESKEKDVTLQILKEELKALQIEMVKNEDRVRKLTSENQTLLDRWLKKAAEEAEKLNEANALYESVIEQAKFLEHKKKQEEDLAKSQPIAPVDPQLLAKLETVTTVTLPTKATRTIEAHKGDCHTIAFSNTGHVIASGGDDNTVKLWDSRSCSLKSTLMGSVQSVMCVAFSPNDEFVLGGSNDNSVRLWGVQSGRARHTLTGHTARVMSATFSPDSQKVISGSHDRSIKIYDLIKGYCIRTIICFSSCNSVCIGLDSRVIVSGHFDHQVRIWDAKSGECGRELSGVHSGQVTSVSISNDGKYVLSNSRDNTLKLIDMRTFDVVNTFSNENYRNGVNWCHASISPDSQYVCAGGADGKMFIWDATTGKLASTLKPGANASVVEATAWAGNTIASCDKSGVITLWT